MPKKNRTKALARTMRKASKALLSPAKRALISAGVPPSAFKVAHGVGASLGIFGDRKTHKTSVQHTPVSTTKVTSNPTWTEVVGKVVSQYAGKQAAGIKVRGRQPLVAVFRPAAAAGEVMLSDMATVSPDGVDNALALAPAFLGGPLFVQASQYQMFVFRKLTFEYETVASSISTGQFAMCYCREPLLASSGADNVPATFADVRATNPSTIVPFRSEKASLDVLYDGQQLFYTDATDSGDPEASRLAIQGQLRAYADTTTGSSEYMGNLVVTYEMDLFYPTVNASVLFAVRYLGGLRPSEYPFVADFVRKIKSERKAVEVRGLVLPDAPYQDQADIRSKSRSTSSSRK